MPGPLPKNPEDRVRRNKTGEDGLGDDIIEMDGEVKPPAGVSFGNPEVQNMWLSLKKSVNTKFYEPSDWAYAVLTLRMWDSVLIEGKMPGAMLVSALDSMLGKMLVTEGDRRRLKIFARRQREEVQETTKKASDFYRDAFDQQARQRKLQVVPDEETG